VYAVKQDIDFAPQDESTVKCDENSVANKEDQRDELPFGYDIALTDWREKLPEELSPEFPRTFQDVLNLMNDLVEERGDIDYWEELYNHKRHGNRKGIKTRHTLRDLKKKQGYFAWHLDRGEWCPKTTNDMQDFIEHLLDITRNFTE
jgi:hypothetical protein